MNCNDLFIQSVKDLKIFVLSIVNQNEDDTDGTYVRVSSEAPLFSWQCGTQRTCKESKLIEFYKNQNSQLKIY